ncbi:MAG: hypothetical protein O3C65_02700 [Proteobacteria bacterium]|nr:hypothetical protein [Pseudomonadota bacterium]MDA1057571.1 hypothetical protein [Pseudomonadota bacterium]
MSRLFGKRLVVWLIQYFAACRRGLGYAVGVSVLSVLLVPIPLGSVAHACGNAVVLASADPASIEKFRSTLSAAQAADPQAQIALANMYRRGEGVAPDRILAYAWLNVAAAHHRDAAAQRDEIATCLDPGQRLEAQLLSVKLLSSITAR